MKVSAVIPTRNRPDLVSRAVRSALEQTCGDLEVIVVIDGADEATEHVLSEIDDTRLRVIVLKQSLGGAEARNAGVAAANGEWIAFLDDDDEWLPEKIARQLEIASTSSKLFPIVSCRLLARSPISEHIWPRRLPDAGEPVSEYLLARRGLFQGEGTVTTSTLLVKRQLLLETPFGAGQKRHQEWDWLLRALETPETELLFAPEPLSSWYIEDGRSSVSSRNNWQYSYEWIERMRPIVTPRAYAAFLLTLVASLAARSGDTRGCLSLLKHAVRKGKPAPIDLLLFCGMIAIPQEYRRRARALFSS